MIESKSESRLSIDSCKDDDPVAGGSQGSTPADRNDMARMGRVQELRVSVALLQISTFLIMWTCADVRPARLQIRG
jgi:hypothetical protein